MSALPRLCAPRGVAERVAVAAGQTVPHAMRCTHCRSPHRPRVKGKRCSVCSEGQRTARLPMVGPVLLAQASVDARGEQRIADCPREALCVEDWIAQGRQGQARCPAGCPVWLGGGGEGE